MRTDELILHCDDLKKRVAAVNKLPILSRPNAALEIVDETFDLLRVLIERVNDLTPYVDEVSGDG